MIVLISQRKEPCKGDYDFCDKTDNKWDKNRNRIEDLLITLSRSPYTELQRAQLNKIGPKELCCRLGARLLNTIHI